jgi:hypothetical protein
MLERRGGSSGVGWISRRRNPTMACPIKPTLQTIKPRQTGRGFIGKCVYVSNPFAVNDGSAFGDSILRKAIRHTAITQHQRHSAGARFAGSVPAAPTAKTAPSARQRQPIFPFAGVKAAVASGRRAAAAEPPECGIKVTVWFAAVPTRAVYVIVITPVAGAIAIPATLSVALNAGGLVL